MVYSFKQMLSFLLIGFTGMGILRGNDTILVTSLANTFFYNVVKTTSNKVYAGTSDGIFEIKGIELYKKNDEKGYLTLDKDSHPVIDPLGIKNYDERKLLHLLPYPDRGREEYHASTPEHLYIVSNGTLYIFRFTPYEVTYPFMSIRTISKNWIGGYPGIFFKGKKLAYPTFCDGYIREFNQNVFICFSDILAYKMPEKQGDTTLTPINLSCLQKLSYKYIHDIYYAAADHSYYLATPGKLIRANKDFTSANVIYSSDGGNISLLGFIRNGLNFSADSMMLTLNFQFNNIDTIVKLKNVIKGGYLTTKNYFLVTKNMLYAAHSDGSFRELKTLHDAHTILGISPSEMLIGTNTGLFHYNAVTNELSTVIKGVEFNEKALFLSENTVSAGSIAGLYRFKVASIPVMIQKNNENANFLNENSRLYLFTVGLCILIIVLLAIYLTIMRKKLNENKIALEKASAPELSREMIEDYIRENLATASISSINDHFNTNTKYIYALFEPEKPGSIIQYLRMQLVTDMKKKGYKIEEISATTGLSESYIRKLKV